MTPIILWPFMSIVLRNSWRCLDRRRQAWLIDCLHRFHQLPRLQKIHSSWEFQLDLWRECFDWKKKSPITLFHLNFDSNKIGEGGLLLHRINCIDEGFQRSWNYLRYDLPQLCLTCDLVLFEIITPELSYLPSNF